MFVLYFPGIERNSYIFCQKKLLQSVVNASDSFTQLLLYLTNISNRMSSISSHVPTRRPFSRRPTTRLPKYIVMKLEQVGDTEARGWGWGWGQGSLCRWGRVRAGGRGSQVKKFDQVHVRSRGD